MAQHSYMQNTLYIVASLAEDALLTSLSHMYDIRFVNSNDNNYCG